MRQALIIIFLFIFSPLEILGCNCIFSLDDSFSKTVRNSEFVAWVKILSFDEYLDHQLSDQEERMPYSMTVEIIKKYKGKENRKRIKIFGDNGNLCRPYLSNFNLNDHYLIAPNPLGSSVSPDYEFFICRTEYLLKDSVTNIAKGNYSLFQKEVRIEDFEKIFKNGNWILRPFIALGILLIFFLVFWRRNN